MRKFLSHIKLKYFIKPLLVGALLFIGVNTFPTKLLANVTETDREIIRLQMIASNPNHQQEISMDALLLPRSLYLLQGDHSSPSRFTFFTKNAILTPYTTYSMKTSAPYGTSVFGRWFYENNTNNLLAPSTCFNLSLSLSTPQSSLKESTTVEVVNTEDTTPIRLMAIGDSLTRIGTYVEHIQNILPNVETVGTICYLNENFAREGRGGWTFNKYFTYINTSDTLDSPFLFPTSVDGTHYKGNTADWKKICTAHPTDSAYGGLQKMARGWKDTGDYLYDANGYYKFPSTGDVMVDPSLPDGHQWIEWNGYAWVTMMPQPTNFEFNFSKYMERFSAAFSSGSPTHISILLGANDFGTFDTLMNVSSYLSYYQQMIDAIHDYDPSIKIIICTPTLAPNQNLLTDDTSSYYRFDRNMKLALYYLLQTYDNNSSLTQNIHIAPMTLTLDTTNGFDYTTEIIDTDDSFIRKTTPTNGIHPNKYGHLLMGNTLAAVIQKFRS